MKLPTLRFESAGGVYRFSVTCTPKPKLHYPDSIHGYEFRVESIGFKEFVLTLPVSLNPSLFFEFEKRYLASATIDSSASEEFDLTTRMDDFKLVLRSLQNAAFVVQLSMKAADHWGFKTRHIALREDVKIQLGEVEVD